MGYFILVVVKIINYYQVGCVSDIIIGLISAVTPTNPDKTTE